MIFLLDHNTRVISEEEIYLSANALQIIIEAYGKIKSDPKSLRKFEQMQPTTE